MREAKAVLALGMGTEMSYMAFGKYAEAALRAVGTEARRLERKLSRYIPTSEVSSINRSAGKNYEKLSSETFELLSRAIQFSDCCEGLFDVTVGPLVNLWDYRYAKVPERARIRQILPLVNYTDLVLDPQERTAGLQRGGQSIDLGGVGKGFASDQMIAIFNKFNVPSACINIGGNVVTMGDNPDGSPWRVGIRHPRLDGLLGLVSVTDKAVVTSGDYQRYFMDSKGKRYHHILDPASGYPSQSGLVSVTIIADCATDADALSTILFIAGMEKGLKILCSFPGAQAIFVDTRMHVFITHGLENQFQAVAGTPMNILDPREGEGQHDKY